MSSPGRPRDRAGTRNRRRIRGRSPGRGQIHRRSSSKGRGSLGAGPGGRAGPGGPAGAAPDGAGGGPPSPPPGPGGPEITGGVFWSRYAGAMLLHAFTARAGAGQVLESAAGAGRGAGGYRFADVALLSATSMCFALGAATTEQVKHLTAVVRGAAGRAGGAAAPADPAAPAGRDR